MCDKTPEGGVINGFQTVGQILAVLKKAKKTRVPGEVDHEFRSGRAAVQKDNLTKSTGRAEAVVEALVPFGRPADVVPDSSNPRSSRRRFRRDAAVGGRADDRAAAQHGHTPNQRQPAKSNPFHARPRTLDGAGGRVNER